ncbi:hypothetical protein B0I27_11728 [Arcticibacter pallidicorallinus]|uniref:Uncharacterized protein n=1 Tax=Arcticibacter pallidicorallinus TaxID=1259464 RepID=A0A2T0TQX5_9SPHI|nr:hypothetical protein [Arcticibacter pallidicorallinus]PRY48041.1 hypothetical protein B0I27_11728 [Arcticibacter pallidicorallinus]
MHKDQRILIYSIATMMMFTLSCTKFDVVDEAEKLKGKYTAVSAYLDRPADINFDGFDSIDLLHEIPDIKSAQLELIGTNGYNLYSHFWPEQYFLYGKPSSVYSPDVKIIYEKKASYGEFQLNKDISEIIVLDKSLLEFVKPSRIQLLEENEINIYFDKTLYTKVGWQDFHITVRYRRYTSTF